MAFHLFRKRANGVSGQVAAMEQCPDIPAARQSGRVGGSGTSWSLADPLDAAARRKARGPPSLCFSAFPKLKPSPSLFITCLALSLSSCSIRILSRLSAFTFLWLSLKDIHALYSLWRRAYPQLLREIPETRSLRISTPSQSFPPNILELDSFLPSLASSNFEIRDLTLHSFCLIEPTPSKRHKITRGASHRQLPIQGTSNCLR